VAPILIGVIPFALIAGLAAVDAGITTFQEIGLSTLVFAGAAQLAAIELIGDDAAVPVIIATVLVINSCMLMYSAALAPYFKELRPLPKVGTPFLLTDRAFAVSILHFEDERLDLDVDAASDRALDTTGEHRVGTHGATSWFHRTKSGWRAKGPFRPPNPKQWRQPEYPRCRLGRRQGRRSR
jgi:hypothetical protein